MLDLKTLDLNNNQNKVFEYFKEICAIPHGSGNMEKIADYCKNFAQKHSFQYIRDNSNNLVIFKNGTLGLENAQPIILQGHIDMVCQCESDTVIDFEKDGLEIYNEGDFIKAKGTTLGGDNGIAVAYIMTILSSTDIPHPPIEAIFTTDEEIGLLGANALDTSILKAKKMINLDSESDDILTVSCAGGQDTVLKLPFTTQEKSGAVITLTIDGLLGGHSGVEINKGRVNANILMARILNHLLCTCEFNIVSVNGGTKLNAIPSSSTAQIITNNQSAVIEELNNYRNTLYAELKSRENDISIDYKVDNYTALCLDDNSTTNLLNLLNIVPNGIMEMSAEIEGLVETSLNLGVLKTNQNTVSLAFALRSSKKSAMKYLENRLISVAKTVGATCDVSGYYPPWEYNENSPLREIYKKCYKEQNGCDIKVEAIHAGLECAVFSSTIKDLDCISVGPNMFDVHTPKEKLSISSAVKTFNLLLKVLSEL
ncbi:MAG: aminoacyl-histidine dipeptidase [Ruminococcaceae bacterium]|nr:aminoacyl-histidine dipeptidase [Oscillospiraceae bacterium]